MSLVRSYGHGPLPALALHCSLAHGGEWAGLGAALAELLTLTAFDLPGHGKAPDVQPGEDLGETAERMALALLPERPVDVIGHSFGGAAALRLTLNHPGRVRRLVLIEPTLFAAAAGTPAMAENDTRLAGFAAAFAAGRPEEAARHFTAVWGAGEPWESLPERQRRYIAERIHLIPASFPVLNGDSGRILAPGRLEALDLPVLILEGGASPPVIGAIAAALAARLPKAERASVPGAAHMLPITHTAAVASAVGGFLSRG